MEKRNAHGNSDLDSALDLDNLFKLGVTQLRGGEKEVFDGNVNREELLGVIFLIECGIR